jgi:hypothetical protein
MLDLDHRRPKTTRSVIFALGMSLCAAIFMASSSPSGAQSRAARALRAVQIERTDSGWIFELEFEFAVQYLRHSPQGPGRFLRISVDPIELGNRERLRGPLREVLPIPKFESEGDGESAEPMPLLEIAYDGSFGEKPIVEMQFNQAFAFSVEPGARSQILRIRVERPRSQTGAATSPSPVPDDSRAGQLLTRSRHAIRDGDLDLAIALLTRVLELPDDESTLQTRMDARELIALTHERRGQLAHAQAEYEAYLEDYPEGPAASRVRQRLDALLTASASPKPPLRRSDKAASVGIESNGINQDVFGSIALRYFRFDALSDEPGADFLATDVLTDVDLAGRIETDSWSVRGDFTGTYDKDIAGEGRSDDTRVSRLSIYVEDRVHRVEATIGRQRRSDSGVLGRFDGLRVAAEFGPHIVISGLVGLPVESTADANPNTDTILAGGAIDVRDLWIPGLQGQFFAVGRNTASLTDRAAIGGELRYSGERTYSFLYLDYDVAFQSLNTFLVSSNYRLSPDTDLRVLIERRNSPILTLETALQGQTVSDIDSLKKIFSNSEIRDLAEDRTAVAWSGTVGATHRPNNKYQVSTDLTVSHLGKTETSGGVEGSDAFGPNFGGTVQLVVNDWLVDGGLGSVGLRYFHGDTFESFAANGYSRFSLPHHIRLLPRLRWEWRDSQSEGESSRLRPSLEIDWRNSSFLLDAQVGFQWEEPISGGRISRETSYFVEAGIRWEF